MSRDDSLPSAVGDGPISGRAVLRPDGPRRLAWVPRLAAGVLIALGLCVMTGWWLRVPWMVEIIPESVGVGFNTGLAFAILGVALALPRGHVWGSRAHSLIGAVLVVLGGLVLIEQLAHRSLGLDEVELHRWLHDGNLQPGRIAPNTCLALMAAGITLLLPGQSGWQNLGRRGALLVLSLFGVSGLLGYWLHLSSLYGWYSFNRMAFPTAVALLVAAAGLIASEAWTDTPVAARRSWDGADGRIALVTATVLATGILGSGFIVFVALQNSYQRTLKRHLSLTVARRITLFEAAFNQSRINLLAITARPGLLRRMKKLDERPHDQKAQAFVRSVAQGFLGLGFDAVSIRDRHGVRLFHAGTFQSPQSPHMKLAQFPGETLMWNQAYFISSRSTLTFRGTPVGVLHAEQPLPEIVASTAVADAFGAQGLLLCGAQGSRIACFPELGHRHLLVVGHYSSDGQEFPISRALAGYTGITPRILDYRNHPVIAAYGPIPGSGLAIVLKSPLGTFYAPIRERLDELLPLMLGLLGLGLAVTRAQVRPLVRQLLESERMAQRARTDTEAQERRVRAVLDNVGDGIIVIDADGIIQSVNPAGAAMFGHDAQALVGQDLVCLMPERYRRLHAAGIARHVHTGVSRIIGKGAVELEGLRGDGTTMAIELVISAVAVGGQESFVGIVRDITDRKHAEAVLVHQAHHDPLTGLPNRALFLDRLQQALLRAARTESGLALAYIDVDHFKEINDTLGHGAGDLLLRDLSSRLGQSVRASDTVARLGGDEFIVLLERVATPTDARCIANKLLAGVRPPFWLDGRPMSVTISIGLAHCVGEQYTPERLIRAADEALYRAKHMGRDGCQEAPAPL